MPDLTEFLLERIAEEMPERVPESELAGDDEGGYYFNSYRHAGSCLLVGAAWGDPACDCGGAERATAECEAKRRIVEMHSGIHECVGWKYGRWDTVLVHPDFMFRHDPTLCLLALPYADHSDYREEWRA